MDLLTAYRTSLDGFTQRVGEVGPEAWAEPTPCPDWNVNELVNHLVGEDRWTPPMFGGSTIADVGDRFSGDLLGDDPHTAAVDAAWQARQAVEAPGALDRTVFLSFGETPATEYLHQLTADHLVHTWDLAAAAGLDRRLDPDAVAFIAAWFADREREYRHAGVIGPAVAVPADAGPQDRLIAAFGRDPAWTSPNRTA
ncbi:TIGR03086 family protein [Catellatospora sp. TT07R-123]|uniref:TIGR03086 family metal-binding protein n=1 Tax=Catellatospora sp. TT07R-123 TaxID=2733863 RepID=UPI001B14C34A|nr:TIGR03086 family metal-binding protein [Catellatospora sp. TT07R-123]GHJ48730.1 TIGR03086 family protein [Catellatospora sp. TT07R-123]